jgi:hypothetical protein
LPFPAKNLSYNDIYISISKKNTIINIKIKGFQQVIEKLFHKPKKFSCIIHNEYWNFASLEFQIRTKRRELNFEKKGLDIIHLPSFGCSVDDTRNGGCSG